MDLVEDWMEKNASSVVLGEDGDCRGLGISGISACQPFDGIMELKVVNLMISIGATISLLISHFLKNKIKLKLKLK